MGFTNGNYAMNTETTFDRDTENHGLVILPNGDQYDAYGDTVEELKADARAIAESLGVEISIWNMELPE